MTTTDHFEKDSLIKLLDYEVDRLERSQHKPGWTKWALMGAAATCLLLLSNQIESKNINWNNIIIIYVVLTIIREFFILFDKLLLPSSSQGAPRFLILQKFGYQLRHSVLFDTSRYFIFYLAFLQIQNNFPVLDQWLLKLYTWSIIILGLLTFLASYFNIPFPTNSKRSHELLITYLILGLITLPAIDGSMLIYHHWESLSQYDVRSGLLFIALIWIIGSLLNEDSISPLLETIIKTRRDLILDLIDLDSAKKQADIAFAGLQVSDLVQSEVSTLLLRIGKMEEIDKEMRNDVHILQELDVHNNLEELRIIVPTVSNSYKARSEEFLIIANLFSSDFKKMNDKIKWILRIAPNSIEDIDKISDKIKQSYDTFYEKHLVIVNQISSITKKLDIDLKNEVQLTTKIDANTNN